MKHLVVIPLDQCQLESVFGGVNSKDLRLGVAVEAVHIASLDADKVDGLVEGANDSVVTAVRRLVISIAADNAHECSNVPIE